VSTLETTTSMLSGADGARRTEHTPPPATRPPARGSALLALATAGVAGLGFGYDARLTALAFAAMVVAAVMLMRLEWAALLVVTTAVFEDYLSLVTPWATKGVAVVLIGSWVVRRGWRPLHRGGRSPVLVVAGVFTLVLLASAVLHNNGLSGADVVVRYLGFLAVLTVLVDTMRAGLSPQVVARAYVASCALASCFAVATFWTGDDRRAGGPVGDPNDFAFFLVAALPLAFVLRGTARRRWVYDLASGLLLVTLALTLSRGALVGVVAMVVVGGVLRLVSLRALGVGLVAAVTLAAVVAGTVPDLVSTSLEQKSVVADQNVGERLDLWQAASTMTLEDPVLGMGPGSFALFHQDYMDKLPRDIAHDLDVAHNTYLEVSSELGFAGLAAWLTLLGTGALSAWVGAKRRRDPLAGGVLVALVGLASASVFVTEQYFLPIWLVLALAAVLQRPPPSTASVLR
jgi:putative inorganic carbon (HCO3(-)) transporter